MIQPTSYKGNKFEPKEDVWSLGLILHEMIIGGHAFDASSPSSLLEKIRSASGQDLWIPPHVHIPRNILYILKMCLEPNPANRITLSTLLKAMSLEMDRRTFKTIRQQNIRLVQEASLNKNSKVEYPFSLQKYTATKKDKCNLKTIFNFYLLSRHNCEYKIQ